MEERPSRDLDRITVARAAEVLDISQGAVRKRIGRGTIAHDRDESGRVHVYVPASKTVHKTDQDAPSKTDQDTDQDVRIRDLQDQIRFLREELERTHAVVMRLTERIPELEPAQDPPRDALGSPQAPPRAKPVPPAPLGEAQAATERPETRSWWRRIFGGE
ncbi:MAG: hypothetical protein AVDCRST_MAG55-1253 [uncultured Rubrobacteraceae bacterium]|uniref:Helix-turn-helix domain-containing protein n=1 Tax=uncultured Rubrobacteraceae bacterium TaxID=349277 RepID=A0A6J4P9L0_9ACTN|nr:MAG: hypothetical protein AVDCRST_MAG55-1253 [uncultured Rubrobacteraceae bacterium]